PLDAFPIAEPGTCLGPVVSPADDACGQLVACGQGAVMLLEVESEYGRVLRGRALGEADWPGRTWSAARAQQIFPARSATPTQLPLSHVTCGVVRQPRQPLRPGTGGASRNSLS